MKRSGFTLIELSIVLIIIGLIIGGVMKGKDLINSADQKKIYNTWVNQWIVTANEYQDRTGNILGDGGSGAPVDNGGSASTNDGRFDNIRLDNTVTVQNKLKSVGLDVPVSNIASTNGGAYNIKGKYATSQAVAYLYYLHSNIDNSNSNKLYIVGMPTDVAIAFDKMADGSVDPQHGTFRIYPDDSVTTWPDASTTTTVNVSLEL